MIRATDKYRQIIERHVLEQGLKQRTNPDPVYARLEHSRWIADCPCRGAQYVAEDEKPMLCGSCGMTSPVVFPDNWRTIEGLVEDRPEVNQNWLPGESVDLLISDNIDAGIYPADLEG